MTKELIKMNTDNKGIADEIKERKIELTKYFYNWIKNMMELGFEIEDVLSFDKLFSKTFSFCLKENSIDKLKKLRCLIDDCRCLYHECALYLSETILMFIVDLQQYKEPCTKRGFVYLIKNPTNNSMKIGRTKNLEQRLNSIRTGVPQAKLFAFKEVDNFIYEEGRLHKKFKEKRIGREWFLLDDKDIKLILVEYGYHEVNPVCVDANFNVANYIMEKKQKRLEAKNA